MQPDVESSKPVFFTASKLCMRCAADAGDFRGLGAGNACEPRFATVFEQADIFLANQLLGCSILHLSTGLLTDYGYNFCPAFSMPLLKKRLAGCSREDNKLDQNDIRHLHSRLLQEPNRERRLPRASGPNARAGLGFRCRWAVPQWRPWGHTNFREEAGAG
jgi:hypothetical protein